jgi:GAF domain-containing protein
VNRDATDALLGLLDRVALAEADLVAAVDDAVDVAQTVLKVDGAGMMLINRDGDFALVGASNVYADTLERSQLALGDGPGFESTRRGAIVAVEDLTEEPRWRELAKPNVRAVLSAPIWFVGRPVGNLNALCRAPREWTNNDRRALTAYAGVITALLRVGVAADNGEDPMVAELRLSLEAQA